MSKKCINNKDVCLSFNGTNSYIYNDSINIGTDPIFTICGWFRRTSDFIHKGCWGLGGGSYNNGISSYSPVTNCVSIDLWGQSTYYTSDTYPLNQWIFVVWQKTNTTFNTSNIKIFINGLQKSLNVYRDNSSVVNLTTGFTLGKICASIQDYFMPVDIFDFRIFKNRILSLQEMNILMEMTNPVSMTNKK